MLKIKKYLKLIFKEIIYGGHLFSFGAISIIYTISILLNIKITWDCLLIIYLGTHSVYLYNRYKELKEDKKTNPERVLYIKKNIKIIPYIIFASLAIFIFTLLLFNKTVVLLFTIALLIFGFLYSLVFKNFTKKIVGFKNFFVSLMWALLAVVLIIYYNYPFNLPFLLIVLFIILRIFSHEVMSDMKDFKGDKEKKLLVFPGIIAKHKLIFFLILISTLSFIPLLIGLHFGLFPNYSTILLLLLPYSYYYLFRLNSEKATNRFVYDIIIDGEYILWFPLILAGKTLI
ncbi:MAG: UbiA family prenyltransferase [Candidatus Falkowbacteria bacterium]